MNPDSVHAYRTAGQHLGNIAHLAALFAVLAGLVTAASWALYAALDWASERRELRRSLQHLEAYANHPANRRKEKP